jgi:alkanesulfonate monooxygenase SsuD/methylene tetrahydromethanopterin reductase-like flavin-dependent oxidoreductase (luciferase family)
MPDPRPYPKFGIQFRNFPRATEDKVIDGIIGMAREGEAVGYDSLWMIDHLMLCPPISFESQPIPECWTTLNLIADATRSVTVGSLVSCALFRNKYYLSTLVDTLCSEARGRICVGLGSGWFDREFSSYGISYPPPRERMAKLEETIKIIRTYFRNRDQQPPPIWVGGSGPKFTLRLVARLADGCSLFGSPSAVQQSLAILDNYSSKYSRHSEEITKSKQSNVVIGRSETEVKAKLKQIVADEAKWKNFSESNLVGTPEDCVNLLVKYWDAGVDYFTLNFPDLFDSDSASMFARQVVPSFKSIISKKIGG